MMRTINENYVNDVDGSTFTSGTSSGRKAPRYSQVVIQQNPHSVRVLGRGACLKNMPQSPSTSPSCSSTNVLTTRLERRMEAVRIIRTRYNVVHSRVNHDQLLLGNWNIFTLTRKELELVEEAKRFHLDFVGVSSTKRHGSGTVVWMTDENSSILVLILCLLKLVWGFSQAPRCQTVCQIGFLCNCNYILFTNLPWPGDSEGIFRSSSQAATCPFVYHTRWRLHSVPLIAERQAGKLLIPIFIVFGLTRPGIEPESTASVADALSTRPEIGFLWNYGSAF